MVSTVSSTQSVSAVGASNSIAKIAELNKQASTLRQQLMRERQASGGEAEAASVPDKTESLTREIVNVQSQIEQLVLEAQLSRLNVASATKADDNGDNAASTPTDGKSGSVKTLKSGHGVNHGNRLNEAYQPEFDAAGKLVNVQA